MNPILLRYVGYVLMAAIAGAGGGYLVVNNKTATLPSVTQSGTIPAFPAQPFPGQGIRAIPAIPAVPTTRSETGNKITVLAPNGGETFCDISQPNSEGWWNYVKWSGNTDRGAKIALLRPEASSDKDPTPHIVGWIVAGQFYTWWSNGNIFSWGCGWTVNNETFTEEIAVSPGEYKILVAADDGKGKSTLWNQKTNKPAANYDISDRPFAIAPKPKLRVISPNGGETFKKGDTVSIRFESIDIPNHFQFNVMDIWLLKANGRDSYLSGDAKHLVKVGVKPGTGMYVYEWNGVGAYEPGDYYIIVDDITAWSMSGSYPDYDKSDATFRIVTP